MVDVCRTKNRTAHMHKHSVNGVGRMVDQLTNCAFFRFSFYFQSKWFRWFHLAFNLIVQLLVGLPLEMVHGSSRIACVYLAGVLAGSMGTSIFDPEVYLVGASGGVYALLAAHLANVMLNYNNMHYGIIRIVGIFLFGKYPKINLQLTHSLYSMIRIQMFTQKTRK